MPHDHLPAACMQLSVKVACCGKAQNLESTAAGSQDHTSTQLKVCTTQSMFSKHMACLLSSGQRTVTACTLSSGWLASSCFKWNQRDKHVYLCNQVCLDVQNGST